MTNVSATTTSPSDRLYNPYRFTVTASTKVMNTPRPKIVWFIIPANLNPGKAFFDATVGRNITIEGSKQRTIAEATRTVTHATTPERIKSWDKATGVFVESIDTLQNYTLNAIANKTNMWSRQIPVIDPTYFTLAALAIAATAATGAYVLIRRRNSDRK